jgi:hypothetical protein
MLLACAFGNYITNKKAQEGTTLQGATRERF